MMRTNLHERSGFTLIEVIVAIMLIAAVIASAFSFFWSIGGARDRLGAASARALSCASLQSLLLEAVQSSEVGSGGGVFSGDAKSLTIPCRVVKLGAADGSKPFARTLKLQFDAGTRSLLASWDGEASAAIVAGVGAVGFRAYDGRQWTEDFNAATMGRLPAAIEISLWWELPEAADSEEGQTQPADALITVRIPDADADGDETQPPDGEETAAPSGEEPP